MFISFRSSTAPDEHRSDHPPFGLVRDRIAFTTSRFISGNEKDCVALYIERIGYTPFTIGGTEA
jgi:hypothetical protein